MEDLLEINLDMMDPYMQILRDNSSDFLSNNNFVMRTALILLTNIFTCLLMSKGFYYYSYGTVRSRHIMYVRGASSLIVYIMYTLFICAGSRSKELFSRNKIRFMTLFAILDFMLFVW